MSDYVKRLGQCTKRYVYSITGLFLGHYQPLDHNTEHMTDPPRAHVLMYTIKNTGSECLTSSTSCQPPKSSPGGCSGQLRHFVYAASRLSLTDIKVAGARVMPNARLQPCAITRVFMSLLRPQEL